MKLLIIGGTGVLSGAVAREALLQGLEVYILHRGTKPHLIPDGAKSIIANANDDEYVKSKIASLHFDAVIDFICYTQKQLEHSFNIFSVFADQYIFISSTCVYNAKIKGIKYEDAPKVLPEWKYSVEKWNSEVYLKNEAEKINKPWTVIRPCVTYDNTRIPYGVMPSYGYHWTLIGRILSGKPVLTWDGGNTRWNIMRVEDFAVGVVGVVGNKAAYNKAFNVSGDEAYSWMDVLKTVSTLLGKEVKTVNITSTEYQNMEPGNRGEILARSLDSIVSNESIKSVVPNFKTTISLREGISQTIQHYRDNNYLKGIDYRFDGSIDRIISKYGNTQKKSDTQFVDYLGNASLRDKLQYYIERHRGSFSSKVLNKLLFLVK